MIFSLIKSSPEHEMPLILEMDLYCFFKVKNSVYLPVSSLKLAILASLKQKKEVILLREPTLPNNISKNLQWDGSDHWLWLSPRSFSIVSRAWSNSGLSSESFVQLISKLKQLK